jgi:hypothetical protein
MRSALCEHTIPTKGRNYLEMARTLDFFNKLEVNLAAPPLATDYSRDDQDLSESDEKEGNDEDPENAEDAKGDEAQGWEMDGIICLVSKLAR